MYATVIWSIDPSSLNSAAIKDRVDKAFGTLTATPLRANIRIARLHLATDLGILGQRFEAIHGDFPTEFDYVCVGSDGGQPVAPAARPTWNEALVKQITAVDD
jgi:hypothetical protein